MFNMDLEKIKNDFSTEITILNLEQAKILKLISETEDLLTDISKMEIQAKIYIASLKTDYDRIDRIKKKIELDERLKGLDKALNTI